MKALVLSSLLLLVVWCPADAATKELKGAAADQFIEQYLPAASVPGPVVGTIQCDVPAMGARSEGAVSTCVFRYH